MLFILFNNKNNNNNNKEMSLTFCTIIVADPFLQILPYNYYVN
jgi:hypothetical protein